MSGKRDKWIEYCNENQHKRPLSQKSKKVKFEIKAKETAHQVGTSMKTASSYLMDKGGRLYKGYDTLITKTDNILEQSSEKIVDLINQRLHSFEEIQHRLGIRVFKSLFSARISGQWKNFLVVDISNPTGVFTETDALMLLSTLYREDVPFKIISRLRKTIGDVEKISTWVEKEFSLYSEGWKEVKNAKLDSELWIADFRRLVDMIANSHQSWRSWLVIPAQGMSDKLTGKFTRLDKYAAYEFLFDLFQSMDENDAEITEFFKAILTGIREGNNPLDSVLPSRIVAEEHELFSSDDVYMHSMNIVTPGVDELRTVSGGQLMFRGLDWLKQRLNICLSENNRKDQIWISVSQLPIKNKQGLLSNLSRHMRSYGTNGSKEEDLSNEEKHYLAWLGYTRDFLKKNPKTPAWQQSYSLLLKSGSSKNLTALKDVVSIVLGHANTWFEEATNEKAQWRGFKRMLPAIWKEEVLENNDIPRNTLPIPDTQLKGIFTEDKYIPSNVGAVVGMLYNGLPLVVGPLHWGVIGTTSVGKSVFLKAVCAMLYPIDPLHIELFVADLIDIDPDSIPPGWYTLLIDMFGGAPIFPQSYKTPKDMREALDKMTDKMVFLYMPNKDTDIGYDLEYLKFVHRRMSKNNKVIKRRIVAIDELNRWFDSEKDSNYLRVSTFTNNIMDQGPKNNTTCCFSLKTLEGIKNSNVECWSTLKTNTRHWLIFDTPDVESIPETIGFPPRSNETIERANRIVNAIYSIRPHGGMSPQELTLGRCVLVTGDVVAQAKIIVPEGLMSVLHRKENTEWGA